MKNISPSVLPSCALLFLCGVGVGAIFGSYTQYKTSWFWPLAPEATTASTQQSYADHSYEDRIYTLPIGSDIDAGDAGDDMTPVEKRNQRFTPPMETKPVPDGALVVLEKQGWSASDGRHCVQGKILLHHDVWIYDEQIIGGWKDKYLELKVKWTENAEGEKLLSFDPVEPEVITLPSRRGNPPTKATEE